MSGIQPQPQTQPPNVIFTDEKNKRVVEEMNKNNEELYRDPETGLLPRDTTFRFRRRLARLRDRVRRAVNDFVFAAATTLAARRYVS